MTEAQERIEQKRKMAHDDPENELAHFWLGQALMEAKQDAEAVQSFRRAMELSPQLSKVYQLLGTCLIRLNRREEAIATLTKGFAVADERGDNVPRDEMAKMLVQLGQPAPQSKRGAAPDETGAGGFPCQRPGCMWGRRARQLPGPPMSDEIGKQIHATICADCWNEWLRNYSIKVINEFRLDLSTERGQAEYDRYMNEFLGLD